MKKPILFAICLTAALFTTARLTKAQDTTSRKDTIQTTKMDTTKAAGDILNVITSNTDYSTLAKVIKVAGNEAQFQATGPITVFAPINQGFVTLTQAKLDSLVKDSTALKAVLQYHIVKGSHTKDNIVKALSGNKTTTLTTLDGGTLTLAINSQKNLEITDANGNKGVVMSFDQKATNGVIHGINNVLQPK